jgi:hypothetical protein
MAIPSLGSYYTMNLLEAAKWPRKVGLLKKPVYSSEVINIVLNQMVDWATAVGAGSPYLAEMIINTYSLESGDSMPGTDAVLDLRDRIHKKIADKAKLPAPHEIINHVRIGSGKKNVPASELATPKTIKEIEATFQASLLLGYCTPKYILDWYKQNYSDHQRDKDKFEKLGMKENLPKLDDWLQDAQDVVNLYKEEMNDDLSRGYDGLTPIMKKLRQESPSP